MTKVLTNTGSKVRNPVNPVFSGRDLSSFFDLILLVLVRRRVSALGRLPPCLVGGGPIPQFSLGLLFSHSETTNVPLGLVGESLTLGYDLKCRVQLTLREPVVVGEASGADSLRREEENRG